MLESIYDGTKTRRYLLHDPAGLLLSEVLDCDQPIEQLAALHQLENHQHHATSRIRVCNTSANKHIAIGNAYRLDHAS